MVLLNDDGSSMTENSIPLSCNLATIFVSWNAPPGVYTPPLEMIRLHD